MVFRCIQGGLLRIGSGLNHMRLIMPNPAWRSLLLRVNHHVCCALILCKSHVDECSCVCDKFSLVAILVDLHLGIKWPDSKLHVF